jgi:hypothetical protein
VTLRGTRERKPSVANRRHAGRQHCPKETP